MKIEENFIVYPLPTSDFLKKREDDFLVTFPENYKKFISKYNGGIPNPRSFTTLDNREGLTDRFLCLLKDYKNNEYGEYDIAVIVTGLDAMLTDNKDLIGEELIPIVKMAYGDYVCLNYKDHPENPTVVFFYTHESKDFDPKYEEISPDFDTFLASFDVEE